MSSVFSNGRRRALAALGLGGAGVLFAEIARRAPVHAAQPLRCVARPEQTEGPYFVDEKLERSDIRIDPTTGQSADGTPLHLTFRVSRTEPGVCAPMAGARVELWHCNADGVYSDVLEDRFDTRERKFLRGHQFTDDAGVARFTTIYPGWYAGRAVHIHFRIRAPSLSLRGHRFTSQLYFDDRVTDVVHAAAPYTARGPRDTRNAADPIYADGGDRLTLDLAKKGNVYRGVFDVGLFVA